MLSDQYVAVAVLLVLIAGALAGCKTSSDVEAERIGQWATAVTPNTTPVHSACDGRRDRVPVPTGGSGQDAARYSAGLLQAIAARDKKYDACATWARGQR